MTKAVKTVNTPASLRQLADDCEDLEALGLLWRTRVLIEFAGHSTAQLSRILAYELTLPISLPGVVSIGPGGQTQPTMSPLPPANLLAWGPNLHEFVFRCLTLPREPKMQKDPLYYGIVLLAHSFGGLPRKDLARRIRVSDQTLGSQIARAQEKVRAHNVSGTSQIGNLLRGQVMRYDLPYRLVAEVLITTAGKFIDYRKAGVTAGNVNTRFRDQLAAIDSLLTAVSVKKAVRLPTCGSLAAVKELVVALLATAVKALHNGLSLSYPAPVQALEDEYTRSAQRKQLPSFQLSQPAEANLQAIRDHFVRVAALMRRCHQALPRELELATWLGRSLEERAYLAKQAVDHDQLLVEAGGCYAESKMSARLVDVYEALAGDGSLNRAEVFASMRTAVDSTLATSRRHILRDALRLRRLEDWRTSRLLVGQVASMGSKPPWPRGDLMRQVADAELRALR